MLVLGPPAIELNRRRRLGKARCTCRCPKTSFISFRMMASKELFVWCLRLCNIFNIQQDKKIIYITAVNKSQIKEVLSAGLWLVFSLAPHENVSCQRMSLQCWCFHSLHGIHTRPHIGNCPTVRRESHLSQCIAPSFSPPSVF